MNLIEEDSKGKGVLYTHTITVQDTLICISIAKYDGKY